MAQKAVDPEVSQEVRSVVPEVWKIVRRREPPWGLMGAWLVDQWVDQLVDQWVALLVLRPLRLWLVLQEEPGFVVMPTDHLQRQLA